MTSEISHEQAILLTTNLLRRQNSQTVKTLQDLLTFIPNPNHVKEILTAAVIRLIYSSPQSTMWLFQNPEVVEPQIQVRETIAQELAHKLLSWGYKLEDFHFTAERELAMSEAAKHSLLSYQPIPSDEPVLILVRALLLLAEANSGSTPSEESP